ncbi:MAG: hypothetical protein ING90_21190 [Rhodocyclaceae bacterium]|nr:hypothetical protein [Rhodocyclaceae bacterium]
MLDKEQAAAARAAANEENQLIRKEYPKSFDHDWLQVHETHPIKFGGSPTDRANKEMIWAPDHWEVSNWWKGVQDWIEKGK